MTYEQFEHIIAQLNFLVAFGLVGMGEPTLNPDLFRMIRLAVGRGFAVHTVTNCNRHTPDIARQLVSTGLTTIGVSIDGATPESYERSRRGGSLQRTVQNLQRLVQLRGHSRLPHLHVEMLALRHNYAEMARWVTLCADCGVDALTIQARMTAWGKQRYADQTVGSQGAALGADFARRLDEARTLAAARGIPLEVLRHTYDRDHVCPKPWRDLYICTTGEVVPCCTIADPRVMTMGNIFRQTFEEIWNSREYVALRDALISNRPPAACFQCYGPQRAVPGVGGPACMRSAQSGASQANG